MSLCRFLSNPHHAGCDMSTSQACLYQKESYGLAYNMQCIPDIHLQKTENRFSPCNTSDILCFGSIRNYRFILAVFRGQDIVIIIHIRHSCFPNLTPRPLRLGTPLEFLEWVDFQALAEHIPFACHCIPCAAIAPASALRCLVLGKALTDEGIHAHRPN